MNTYFDLTLVLLIETMRYEDMDRILMVSRTSGRELMYRTTSTSVSTAN